LNLARVAFDTSAQGRDIMADRTGLKLVGFVFGSMTVAVMMIAGVMVKAYADGSYSFDTVASISATGR
jgi:hypothetical protein